ncbi:MAG: glutamine-hydrolyzing GMP synthase [Planctomycetes bacterium]|nr:glutamine-hydrolyzing GMP synthase [Planctomycetota bacterium]
MGRRTEEEPAGRHELVAILDFGSQYGQLIARRVRERGVYCEILPHDTPAAELRRLEVRGLILSGGPASVYEPGSPRLAQGVLELGVPVLGICYGMQLLCQELGCRVAPAERREYGRSTLEVHDASDLFAGLGRSATTVWMSHGDRVDELGPGFVPLASTANSPHAAVRHGARRVYGIQFHPEVTHTSEGAAILDGFLRRVCGCRGDWAMSEFAGEAVEAIRRQVGPGRVVCGLSGGVDSTVVAALVDRAVGERLSCIFVDNGLLRAGEREAVEGAFRDRFRSRLHTVDAGARFLGRLAGVRDPEDKRLRIGHEFVAVFREAAGRVGGAGFLAQGTLYPDVIESRHPRGGPSATIKTHHNVGGLPPELGFELVEPLRSLFKDEVRAIGRELGIPRELLVRHPFPGPGLAVRVLGEVTPERLSLLRAADRIVTEEVRAAGLYEELWQAFAVLLPVGSVGVMGDQRTYEGVVAVRAVESTDGMTADWVRLPHDLLGRISTRITQEVAGVNRVVYDVTSKPPGTIEWE